MTIPFLQVRPKSIKLKVSPRFPAQLLDGVGTTVIKANGNYTVNLDYTDFPPYPSAPNGIANLYSLTWDFVLNKYILLPVSQFTTIPDAPLDGQIYARQSGAWVLAPTGGGGGITDGPSDGSLYGRLNGTWTKALPLAGGTLTGNLILFGDPLVALGAATKQYVDAATVSPATVAPLMDATAVVGTSLLYARQDHVHPSDTTKAPLASPTFTGTPAAPTATAGTNTTQLATTAFVQSAIGTPGIIPENAQSANYTLVLADAGKLLHHPASDANARTFTIPANASVAYTVGTVISFTNLSANALSIAITTDTMYLAGTGTTGTRTLAQYGCATAVKTDTTTWMISGTGLT